MAKSYTGTVEIEVDGKKYTGSYTVEGGKMPLITVSALDPVLPGQKTTQLGGSPADVLARVLLHEIVAEVKEKGWPKGG